MPESSKALQDQYLERPLPSNVEAEKVILGSVFLNNNYFSQVLESLKAEDFYSPFHRYVFRAMLNLFSQGKKIDPLLVVEELKREGLSERFSSAAAITELFRDLPHLPSITEYIRIVLDKSRMRKLINTCNQIIAETLAEEQEANAMLDKAEQMIFLLSEERTRQGFSHVKPIADEVFVKLQEYSRRETHALTGLATGFIEFDKLTSGLQKTDLIILAARPSMGKTAFALTIAQNAAIQENAVVAIFSLEISKQQLVMRMLSSEAKVDAHRFRTGFLSKEEWQRLTQAVQTLSQAKIFIDDTPGISALEMRAKARRLKTEQKQLDLIIVDYLQLMRSSRGYESRYQEVSEISRELKSLAKEMDVPVLALSQLTRAPETRNPPKPQMSDLRESGSLEQDADVVAFIYREEYYRPTEENQGIAEIILAKQRNGPTGTIRMAFLKEFTRFENLYEGEAF